MFCQACKRKAKKRRQYAVPLQEQLQKVQAYSPPQIENVVLEQPELRSRPRTNSARPSRFTLHVRKTLVLDLDETLVHTFFKPGAPFDYAIKMVINGNRLTAYVHMRPHVMEFLARMRRHFNVVVFTASVRDYCDAIMDKLDPHRDIRRYYRDDCISCKGQYVKDLRRIGTEMHEIILIDDQESSAMLQPENALICPAFVGDQADAFLKRATPYILTLRECKDVRPRLREIGNQVGLWQLVKTAPDII